MSLPTVSRGIQRFCSRECVTGMLVTQNLSEFWSESLFAAVAFLTQRFIRPGS